MHDNLELEVFRAGDYGEKGRWDEGDLDRIAADYDPALHEAPVTLDHAQGGPALGWVAAVRRVGDRLVARLRGLNLKLLELLRQGAFKKRSVEIYPALRETGRPYLRAVSFLGAAVPEVKGLADPIFGEGNSEMPTLVFEEEADEVGRSCRERHEPPTPAENATVPDSPAPESTPTAPYNSEPQPPAPDAGETPALPTPAVEPFSELAARLRAAGAWRPAWAERGLADFYAALAGLPASIMPAGQDGQNGGEGAAPLTPAAWFAAFLESLPPVVAFGEAAPAPATGTAAAHDFITPSLGGSAGFDPASLDLHREAIAFQQAHPAATYAEALLRCASGRS
jgi:hypothetical protein